MTAESLGQFAFDVWRVAFNRPVPQFVTDAIWNYSVNAAQGTYEAATVDYVASLIRNMYGYIPGVTYASELVSPYAHFLWEHLYSIPVNDEVSKTIWLWCEERIGQHQDWDFHKQAEWMLGVWEMASWGSGVEVGEQI